MSAASPFGPRNCSHYDERGLFERSTAARTFGSLGIFLVLIFLGAGIYLLQQALTDPLGAEAVSILAGAFILTLAVVMLGLLFTPRKNAWSPPEEFAMSKFIQPASPGHPNPFPLNPSYAESNHRPATPHPRHPKSTSVKPAGWPRNTALPKSSDDATHAPR